MLHAWGSPFRWGSAPHRKVCGQCWRDANRGASSGSRTSLTSSADGCSASLAGPVLLEAAGQDVAAWVCSADFQDHMAAMLPALGSVQPAGTAVSPTCTLQASHRQRETLCQPCCYCLAVVHPPVTVCMAAQPTLRINIEADPTCS